MGFSRQKYWSGLPLPSPGARLLTFKSELCYLLNISHWKVTWEILALQFPQIWDGAKSTSFREFLRRGHQLSCFIEPKRSLGFPGGASGKEPRCHCRRQKSCGFSPWTEKTPWRRPWQPPPVFLPGKSHGQRTLAMAHKAAKSQTWLKCLSTHAHKRSSVLRYVIGMHHKLQRCQNGERWSP